MALSPDCSLLGHKLVQIIPCCIFPMEKEGSVSLRMRSSFETTDFYCQYKQSDTNTDSCSNERVTDSKERRRLV